MGRINCSILLMSVMLPQVWIWPHCSKANRDFFFFLMKVNHKIFSDFHLFLLMVIILSWSWVVKKIFIFSSVWYKLQCLFAAAQDTSYGQKLMVLAVCVRTELATFSTREARWQRLLKFSSTSRLNKTHWVSVLFYTLEENSSGNKCTKMTLNSAFVVNGDKKTRSF